MCETFKKIDESEISTDERAVLLRANFGVSGDAWQESKNFLRTTYLAGNRIGIYQDLEKSLMIADQQYLDRFNKGMSNEAQKKLSGF